MKLPQKRETFPLIILSWLPIWLKREKRGVPLFSRFIVLSFFGASLQYKWECQEASR